ncbi:Crp/Fnr family transcriptional regulator [Cohnella panacarvi]|uniref:Crp/Fnr family transcriptional regulator n=1 Tax=Cohnella panacarvi TaxID=400776 RepID=UPI00047B2F25|nr:Crp/Fnr family transcriptional regulator [Cohnella panacarvi]
MAAMLAFAPIPCETTRNEKGITSFLTAAQFELLEEIMAPKRAKAGTVLFWEGEPCNKLIYVRSGKVMLRKTTEDGKSLILSILQAGDLIGELGGGHGVAHGYSAEVVDNAELGIIAWKDIDMLFVQHSDLALPFMNWMALNHRVTESKLRDLLLFGKPGALASTLIRMANSFGVVQEDGIRINLKLTNTEMAEFIGTTRESVNRMLNGLKEEGTIDMQGGRIIIRDLGALKKIGGCPECPACPGNVCCI